MLKIRLTRRGKKNKAFFRLVVAEHTSPIKGKFIEVLGFLNPHTKEKNLKVDRIKHWLEKGAQCSDSAHNLLVASGIVKGPKRAVKMKKKGEPTRDAAQGDAVGEEKDSSEEKKSAEEAKSAEIKPGEKKEAIGEQKKEETKTEKTEELKSEEKKNK